MTTTDQTKGNSEVQQAIDALANGGKEAAIHARATSGYAIPGDVGASSVARTLTEQLTKTRNAISGITTALDQATVEMTKLWNQIERDREVLADLQRGEAMIAAAIREGQKPAFQRG